MITAATSPDASVSAPCAKSFIMTISVITKNSIRFRVCPFPYLAITFKRKNKIVMSRIFVFIKSGLIIFYHRGTKSQRIKTSIRFVV